MFPLQPIPTVPATPPREDSANTQVIWDFTQLHLNSHLQGGPQDTLPSGNFLAPPRWVNICQTIKSFSGPIGVCSREDSFSQLASTQDGMGTIVVATNLTCVSLALSVLPFLDFPFWGMVTPVKDLLREKGPSFSPPTLEWPHWKHQACTAAWELVALARRPEHASIWAKALVLVTSSPSICVLTHNSKVQAEKRKVCSGWV